MQLSKEEYARKKIYNGWLAQTESPVTQDNCSASLGKPRDAEYLPVTEFSIRSSQPFKIRIRIVYWRNAEKTITHQDL